MNTVLVDHSVSPRNINIVKVEALLFRAEVGKRSKTELYFLLEDNAMESQPGKFVQYALNDLCLYNVLARILPTRYFQL